MKTLIIGAGPAGLNAAIHASNENNSVIVIEKNEKAGKKLFITGKGRCNVTNNCDENEFIKNIVNNSHFLYSAIYHFSSQDTINFFNSNGTPLITERGNRVFPESGKSYDITDCFVNVCKKKGVAFHFNETVTNIKKVNEQFVVNTSKDTYLVDFVVIATGGLAYPSTGSTGDGYKFAKNFGHTVIELVPALTGIKIKENVPHELDGFSLKNVTLSVKGEKNKHFEFGELTFRNDYLDGPIALSISSFINRVDGASIKMELDFKPALSESKLEQRILRDLKSKANEDIYSLLRGLLVKEVITFFNNVANFNLKEKCNTFSKENRIKLIHYLKHFPLTYNGLNSFNRSIVTSGGINVKEINSSTMESKVVSNLYFAGEVIDVDALTGGFNIQIALSTGALAGDSIKEKIDTF